MRIREIAASPVRLKKLKFEQLKTAGSTIVNQETSGIESISPTKIGLSKKLLVDKKEIPSPVH
jgi:hypothetical protein